MANTEPSNGDWSCPRCETLNIFCEKCTMCSCPHPLESCPQCTYHNAYNAAQCEMCDTELNTSKSNDKVSKEAPFPPFLEQSDDDVPLQEDDVPLEEDDDEDDIMDLTEYVDPQSSQINRENVNKMAQNAINTSILSDQDTHYLHEMNDDDGNDMQLQQILNLSRKEHQDKEKLNRLSQQYEEEQMKQAMQQSLISANNENDHQNNDIYGDFDDLFGGYSHHASNTNNSNNMNGDDDDVEVFKIHEPIHCDNIRKRKRNRNDNIESPRKKRKHNEVYELDDLTQSMSLEDHTNDEKSMNVVECDMFDAIDPDTLPKKDRERIETSFQKFLGFYLRGNYGLRTVCIEYGPKFEGRSAKFREILSNTEWRPTTLALPNDMAFECCDNKDLPEFVCRFKHYTLKTDKRLIYYGANNPEEIKKLHKKTQDGMARYFFPRLLDKKRTIYDTYVMIRLNWTDFKKIWSKQSKIYASFDALILRVTLLSNVSTINIILEDVAQKIEKIQNKKQNQDNYHEFCPFNSAQELKDTMMGYYFADKRLHFTYTRNQSFTAEYVVRASRTLAEHRFKKIRVNQLTISDHNRKGVRGEKSKSMSDIFFSTLISMHNLSEKHAGGIIAKYKTIGCLMNKYAKCTQREGELLLQDITASLSGRRIGPKISKRVYHAFYNNMDGNKKMNE